MDLRKGLSCLLIEDNQTDARLIQCLLNETGGVRLSFTHVLTLADALEVLSQNSFDVILVDLTLPDSNGLKTLETLRHARADTAIVILTGLDATDIAIGAVRRGAQDYLVKGRGDGKAIMRALLYAVERQRTTQRLLLAEAAFQTIDTGIMVTDAAGKVIRVNPAFCRVTGFDSDEVEGAPSSLLRGGLHEPAFYQELWRHLRTKGAWEGEIWARRKNGGVTPEWLRINVVRDETGGTAGYVAIFSDITFRSHVEQDLLRQATTDPLTGLGNRQIFQRLLTSTIEQCTRYQREAALLFLDLDGFKEINDTAGHTVGDAVLREVAGRLRGTVRVSDEVARLGGDEFVVILPEVHDRQAVDAVAAKLLQEMTRPFSQSSTTLTLTTSIGIAMIPQDGHDGEALVAAADTAMYAAKRAGKNTVRFYADLQDTSAQQDP